MSASAPAGAWTRNLPGDVPGQIHWSIGQTPDGKTVWVCRSDGRLAWSVTSAGVEVPLEEGACPVQFQSELGSADVERLLERAGA